MKATWRALGFSPRAAATGWGNPGKASGGSRGRVPAPGETNRVMQESRLLHWKEAVGVVFCCACPGKRGPPGKAQAYPEQNGTLSMTSHCKVIAPSPRGHLLSAAQGPTCCETLATPLKRQGRHKGQPWELLGLLPARLGTQPCQCINQCVNLLHVHVAVCACTNMCAWGCAWMHVSVWRCTHALMCMRTWMHANM